MTTLIPSKQCTRKHLGLWIDRKPSLHSFQRNDFLHRKSNSKWSFLVYHKIFIGYQSNRFRRENIKSNLVKRGNLSTIRAEGTNQRNYLIIWLFHTGMETIVEPVRQNLPFKCIAGPACLRLKRSVGDIRPIGLLDAPINLLDILILNKWSQLIKRLNKIS